MPCGGIIMKKQSGGSNMDYRYRDILLNDGQLGPYPLEKLKRVDAPTTRHSADTKRRSIADHAFGRALRGEYGPAVKSGCEVFKTREPLLAALNTFQYHIADYKLPEQASEKAPIPDDPRVLSRHIKKLAYFLGADMVGICALPQSAVYASDGKGNPVEAEYKYAIVVLNVKKTDTIRASYGREWIDDPVSFQVYQRCACQGMVMADYILRLGYPAYPSVVGKYTTLMTPLIIESGLGEGSRLGIAVNPFVGASFKAAAVLTDLPLEPDKPIDFGLQEYCLNCRICAEQCPMHAISDREKELYNGYETWRQNYKLCISGVMTNPTGNMCQHCAKVCPWNRPDNRPEDFQNWDGSLDFLYESVNRQAQRIRKNNFVEPTEFTDKWWFPYIYKDGSYVEAPEFDYSLHEARMKQVEKYKSEGRQWSIAPDYD
jgi:ferredoxin